MPRLMRTLLLLSVLSLLMVPTGKAAANHTGEIVGELLGANLTLCTQHHTQVGNMRIDLSVTEHQRCVGGTLTIFAGAFTATNDVAQTAICQGTGDVGQINSSIRETSVAGRGRVGPNHLQLSEVDQECRVRITGSYHRVGTDALGRLVIDLHRADGTFREWYCARFVATAVTVPGQNFLLIPITIEGRQPCRAAEMRDDDRTHGRDPADNFSMEHDSFHH